MLGPRRHSFALWLIAPWLCAALFAGPASAQDPIGITVAPFGQPYSSGAALSEEVELELELDPGLLVLPAADVRARLSGEIADAPREQLGRAMRDARVQVLLRARTDDEGSRALILMHRAPDGEVLYGKVVDINEHIGSAGPLAQELAAVAKDVDFIDPLPAGDLEALERELGARGGPDGRRIAGEPEPDPEPEPPPQPRDDPSDPPDRLGAEPGDAELEGETGEAGAPDEGEGEGDDEEKRLADPGEDDEEDDELYLFDRIGRATLRLTPPFLSYSACQPATPSDTTPFLCQGAENAPPQGTTLVPWLTPASAGVSLELYPWIPFVGLQIDASVFRTVAELPEGVFDREGIIILGGDFSAFALAQGAFSFGILGVAAGLRAGYILQWALADRHMVVDAEGNTYDVTVFPGYFSHNPALGFHGQVNVHEYVRATLDVDVIPFGLHFEGHNTIGGDNYTLGGHSRLQVDVDPAFGIVLSAFVDAVALSVRSSGPGTRLTRNLERFSGGQANLFVIKPGIGIGYHF